jgi:sugar lactone lactonase YvrE
MATVPTASVEVFGTGVLRAEGVVIDREGNAWGGGRNGKVYKVSPDGVVHEVAQLPDRAIPNGVTMDRTGNFVYCDLRHKAVMRCAPDGKVAMIADRAGDLPLSIPNFASYDAEGNLLCVEEEEQETKNVSTEGAYDSRHSSHRPFHGQPFVWGHREVGRRGRIS